MTALVDYTAEELAVPEIAGRVNTQVQDKLIAANDALTRNLGALSADMAVVNQIMASLAWGVMSDEYKALTVSDAVTLRLALDQLNVQADALVDAAGATDAVAAARAAQ